MKNHIILFLLLFFTQVSLAQESFFKGNNNYVSLVTVMPSEISMTGLVMNLDAGNPSSYSGSGSTWTDLTGKGNNGTISAGITYNNANGGYFQFINSKGIVLPAASSDFNFGTGDFTIEFWANPNHNDHRLISINTKPNDLSSAIFVFTGSSQNGNLGEINVGGAIGLSTTGFTWGRWHQVVISRISTNFSIYIDGVFKANTSSSASLRSNIIGGNAATTTTNSIGSFSANSTYLSYTGRMSIVRVYKNVGLTSSQVSGNFNAIKSRFGL
ncbi:MAG: Synechococcus phage [Bacteroidota bacterium]|jgi:hypothetical protein